MPCGLHEGQHVLFVASGEQRVLVLDQLWAHEPEPVGGLQSKGKRFPVDVRARRKQSLPPQARSASHFLDMQGLAAGRDDGD